MRSSKETAYATAYAREWRARNREHVNEYQREYRRRRPEYFAERALMAQYGLTMEMYDAILEGQGGVCAICKEPHKTGDRTARLGVDHDHESGRVRGLLCRTCNVGLGAARDDATLLRTMADYLDRHATNQED